MNSTMPSAGVLWVLLTRLLKGIHKLSVDSFALAPPADDSWGLWEFAGQFYTCQSNLRQKVSHLSKLELNGHVF